MSYRFCDPRQDQSDVHTTQVAELGGVNTALNSPKFDTTVGDAKGRERGQRAL